MMPSDRRTGQGVAVDPATPTDVPGVLDLLERSSLPTAGLLEHLSDTFVARVGEAVVGCAALERYQDGGLLRSVAVVEAYRGSGLGRRLTDAVIARASDTGIPVLFLLTTTAEGYFPRFGFERVTRADVPLGVRQSVEFASACPATATVFRKVL